MSFVKYDFLKIDNAWSAKQQFEFIKLQLPWGQEQIQCDLFCSVLPKITSETPCMVELGSGGVGDGDATDCSQYSILFEKWFNYNCVNICTEVRRDLIEAVATDWKGLHLVNAKCYWGYNGEWKGWQWDKGPGDAKRLRVADLLQQNNISKIDILHVDIQGSEKSLCEELEADGLYERIKYFFISIHEGEENGRKISREETLQQCKNILERNIKVNYLFLHPHAGGWGDGILVAENLQV